MKIEELLDQLFRERQALDASIQILKNVVTMILEEEKVKRNADMVQRATVGRRL